MVTTISNRVIRASDSTVALPALVASNLAAIPAH